MSLPPRTTVLPVDTADLTSRIVMVIGANVGIGFEAAKHFATMKPAKLILACRDESKGQAALEKIRADTGYTGAEVWILDLASFASVSAFADKVDSDLDRLDILVQNAAVVPLSYAATKDGWETMLQVNYISQALLAIRMLPILTRTSKLANTATPRLVIVSSAAALWTEWDKTLDADILKTLNKSDYTSEAELGTKKYPFTKLLEMFLVRTLQTRVGSSIIVNAVCPNFCYSELRRDLPPAVQEVMKKMEEVSAYTSEEGSRQLVYAAIGKTEDEGSLRGAFIQTNAVSNYGEFIPSEAGVAVEKKTWDETMEVLDSVDPKVKNVLSTYIKSAP